MSVQGQDVKAAERIFDSVFAEEDKKAKKELVNEFLQGFLMEYPIYRKRLKDGGTQKTLDALEQSKIQLTGGKAADRASSLYLAKNLGRSLGIFLAAVEFGVCNSNFDTRKSLQASMITNEIALKLKMLGKTVNPKFLQKRIDDIAKKNKGKLSSEQQLLITRMAAAFLR